MPDAFEAVASPRRRQILRLVWGSERSAGEIAGAMPEVTFGAVSQHLKLLTEAGLVARRQEGRSRLYRARPEALGPVRDWLGSMWSDALERLKEQAEREAAARPRANASRPSKSRTPAPPLHMERGVGGEVGSVQRATKPKRRHP